MKNTIAFLALAATLTACTESTEVEATETEVVADSLTFIDEEGESMTVEVLDEVEAEGELAAEE